MLHVYISLFQVVVLLRSTPERQPCWLRTPYTTSRRSEGWVPMRHVIQICWPGDVFEFHARSPPSIGSVLLTEWKKVLCRQSELEICVDSPLIPVSLLIPTFYIYYCTCREVSSIELAPLLCKGLKTSEASSFDLFPNEFKYESPWLIFWWHHFIGLSFTNWRCI